MKISRSIPAVLLFALTLNLAPELRGQLTFANIGHTNDGGTAQDIVLSGNHAYVAAGTNGLLVYDISHPSVPVKVGHAVGTAGVSGYHIAVSGNDAYVTSINPNGGFNVYDISNPTNPAGVFRTNGNLFGGVATAGTNLYIGGDSRLPLFTLANPTNPVLVTNFSMAANPTRLFIGGNYIAAAANAYVDIGVISNGLYVASLGSISIGGLGGTVTGVAISGQYAFASGNLGQNVILRSFLISSDGPVGIGQIAFSGTNATGSGNCIVISGEYAFVGCSSGLQAINIANPTNLLGAGTAIDGFGGSALGIAVSGPYLYVANGGDGLRVFEVVPGLTIAQSTNQTLLFSWPDFAPFMLQQRSLTGTSWTTLTNVPVLVGASNQITLFPSANAAFYRLASP